MYDDVEEPNPNADDEYHDMIMYKSIERADELFDEIIKKVKTLDKMEHYDKKVIMFLGRSLTEAYDKDKWVI